MSDLSTTCYFRACKARKSWCWMLIAGFLANAVVLTAPTQADQAQSPVPQEVVDGMRRFVQRIKNRESWRFEYRVNLNYLDGSGNTGSPYHEVVNARKGELTLLHFQAPKTEVFGALDSWQVYKNGVVLMRNNMMGVQIGRKYDTYVFGANYYLRGLGIDTFGDAPHQDVGGGLIGLKKANIPRALLWYPEALEQNLGRYALLRERETVDSSECIVLEWPGMERICVDPQHGYLIRKRRSYFNEHGPLHREVQNLSLAKVQDDFWLPRVQIVDEYFFPDSASELINKPRLHYELSIRKWDFDTLQDSDFDLEIPVGAIVLDEIRQMTYQVQPGTGHPMDLAISRVQENFEWSGGRIWVVVTTIFVAVFLLFDQIRRFRKPSKSVETDETKGT